VIHWIDIIALQVGTYYQQRKRVIDNVPISYYKGNVQFQIADDSRGEEARIAYLVIPLINKQ